MFVYVIDNEHDARRVLHHPAGHGERGGGGRDRGERAARLHRVHRP